MGTEGSERRRLPVVQAEGAPPPGIARPRINANCTLVCRTGVPVYASCEHCTLDLSHCLQFRGQIAAFGIAFLILLLVFVPLPGPARGALGAGAVTTLVLFLRHIALESRLSIELTHQLRGNREKIHGLLLQHAEVNVELARTVKRVKEAQDQLTHAAKIAAVGTLAAGVAHELNNPLAYMTMNLEFIAEEMERFTGAVAETPGGADLAPALVELPKAISEARDGVERMRTIVSDLRTFARVDQDERGPVDVRAVVESALSLTLHQLRRHAQVTRDYGEVPPCLGNASRLGQVVVNLLINAAQAIPEGKGGENEIAVRLRAGEGGFVILEVRDTGTGIPPEVQRRIFEPFFTTKPVGVGTGLGLSICHGIITSMGGRIELDSEVGKGTVFRLVLPPAPVRPRRPSTRPSAPRGVAPLAERLTD